MGKEKQKIRCEEKRALSLIIKASIACSNSQETEKIGERSEGAGEKER